MELSNWLTFSTHRLLLLSSSIKSGTHFLQSLLNVSYRRENRKKKTCVKKPYMFWIIFLFKHMPNLFLTQGQKSPLWPCLPNNRDLRLASLNEYLSSINRYGKLFFYLKQCYFGLISVPIWLTFQWSKQQVKSLLLCIVSGCTHEQLNHGSLFLSGVRHVTSVVMWDF